MDQLSVFNSWEIRNVSSNTNYMVINRMKASRTVKWRQTKNICNQGETPITTYNAKIVSMAPELSLATIGGEILVIEVPKDVPMPDIATVAYIMTSIAQMVIHREAPKETLVGLGEKTKTFPNIYKTGKEALAYCASRIREIQEASVDMSMDY